VFELRHSKEQTVRLFVGLIDDVTVAHMDLVEHG
jgi:hypothetical protein